VCPGINDGAVLDDTLAGVLDQYPELASMCIVPLGVSRYSNEARMRSHTQAEAEAVVDCVEDWQNVFRSALGRRLVFAADEYYLLADRPFPTAEAYETFAMHEDGIGMARTFEAEFEGHAVEATGIAAGFFAWVEGRLDGAPFEPYRGPRTAAAGEVTVALRPRGDAPVGILTGEYGARVLEPIVARVARNDVRVIAVPNEFFGGNISVTGLMVGEDIDRVLSRQPAGHRYLLPDVCLSAGRFLDGTTPSELARPVEIVTTDGQALRAALAAS
jgi:NifB/MoaA-like Fe-S oxidoreductase